MQTDRFIPSKRFGAYVKAWCCGGALHCMASRALGMPGSRASQLASYSAAVSKNRGEQNLVKNRTLYESILVASKPI